MTQTATHVTGTWTIDPMHSDVSFSVRHIMMTKVKGRFTAFTGALVTTADPLGSSVTAEIALASVDTNNPPRDEHLRSADFFDVENFPSMSYRSTSLESSGDEYVLHGELTLKGVTREVPLQLEVNGFGTGRFDDTRAAFTATGTINRKDFGMTFTLPLANGGVVVGDRISITLEIQAVLDTP